MAKRSKKSAPAPKRSLRRASIIALSLALMGTLAAVSLGTVIGRRGIPAARQEGCVTGVTKAVFNIFGQEAEPAKVESFCTQTLGSN